MTYRFPIGIQTFSEIRENHLVYVDKTELIYRLVNSGKFFFLSRPRRFGKSLLISTLDAYFRGRKELFKGLKIEQHEQEWIQYPVLRMDLSDTDYHEKGVLEAKLHDTLNQWEQVYGQGADVKVPGLRFSGVIRQAYQKTGRKVVILIDEYEKPILNFLFDEERQQEHRQILNGFYAAIKANEEFIRFVFLTGVTKIGKLSVFSALNNIRDLSLLPNYAEICGITESELEESFHDDVQAMAEQNQKSYDEMKALLKIEYDGYHFSENTKIGLYNPYSLLNALDQKRIDSYWYETGTPTFLVELLKQEKPDFKQLEGSTIEKQALSMINSFTDNPLPILYQSGYLTIKDYDPVFSEYTLGYPNREVKDGFLKGLVPLVLGVNKASEFLMSRFVRAVQRGDTDAFFEQIGYMLADVPYELKLNYEVHFQNFLYLLFKLMAFYVEVEYHTAVGRIDLVLKTDRFIYVMEFKRDRSAEEAMKQIKEKGYAEPFKGDGRAIVLIGVNFKGDMSGLDGVLREDL